MGAAFVIVNNWMAFFRKYYITKQWMRPIETCIFSFATATVFFWAPYVLGTCEPNPVPVAESNDNLDLGLLVTYTCPDNYYNPLGTMLFNTEGSAIRTIISG